MLRTIKNYNCAYIFLF